VDASSQRVVHHSSSICCHHHPNGPQRNQIIYSRVLQASPSGLRSPNRQDLESQTYRLAASAMSPAKQEPFRIPRAGGKWLLSGGLCQRRSQTLNGRCLRCVVSFIFPSPPSRWGAHLCRCLPGLLPPPCARGPAQARWRSTAPPSWKLILSTSLKQPKTTACRRERCFP